MAWVKMDIVVAIVCMRIRLKEFRPTFSRLWLEDDVDSAERAHNMIMARPAL
jgi:hypothetical protein